MIDSLVNYLPKINSSKNTNRYSLLTNNYIVATFHRPSNVDSEENLNKIVSLLNKLSVNKKVIFPIHPRTKNNLEKYGLVQKLNSAIVLTEPLGYLDFISLIKNCHFVITDSGGIQEESTFLGIPCITVRKTTERPITVEAGTNILVGEDFEKALDTANEILGGKIKKGEIPELWDGKAAERIIGVLVRELSVLQS